MTPNPSTIAMDDEASSQVGRVTHAPGYDGSPQPPSLTPRSGRLSRHLRGKRTKRQLGTLVEIISRSGNPDEEFFYLGGPMTGIPQFNFPRFHAVANRLRQQGYNIISPAELDDPETEAAALASTDGAPGSGAAHGEVYEDFLARDLIIVSLPTCVGGIFLEGWHTSRGARAESWSLTFLQKPTFEYVEGDRLVQFDRDERLAELGVPAYAAGSVPRDKPGLLTVADREARS